MSDVTDQLGNVKPWVASAAQTIADTFGLSTFYGYGQRSDPTSDHPRGLALDVPVGQSVATGDKVADFATANAAALGIKYVIWKQRLWKPGQGWTSMAWQAGSHAGYDPNHMRHVHLSFTDSGPAAGSTTKVTSAVSSATSSISDAVSGLNPLSGLSDWPTKVLAIGLKLAGVIAGGVLVVLGMQRLVAPAANAALDRTKELIT